MLLLAYALAEIAAACINLGCLVNILLIIKILLLNMLISGSMSLPLAVVEKTKEGEAMVEGGAIVFAILVRNI